MKRYSAIFKARFLTLMQYKAAAFAAAGTQIFWGIIYVMIYTAFYKESDSNTAISLNQAITFVWISQGLLQILPWNFDKEIQEQIRTGNVAYELIRPLDLYWMWFMRSTALRTGPTLLRCIPMFIVAGLFFGLSAPNSTTALVSFLLSCLFAIVLSSAITTIVMITLFWTISGEGILRLMPTVAVFFAGVVVPLPLFPDWMQPFLSLQPLRGILDIPSRIYTGIIAQHEVMYYLIFQCLWATVIILWGRMLMQRALRKVVIQGG